MIGEGRQRAMRNVSLVAVIAARLIPSLDIFHVLSFSFVAIGVNHFSHDDVLPND